MKSQALITISLVALLSAAASLVTTESALAGFGRMGGMGGSHMGGMSRMGGGGFGRMSGMGGASRMSGLSHAGGMSRMGNVSSAKPPLRRNQAEVAPQSALTLMFNNK